MKLFGRAYGDTTLIFAVVVLAICVRLLSFTYLSTLAASNPSAAAYPIMSGDSIEYAHYADNILALHAYQDVPGIPLNTWPPGYPAVLAAMKAFLGNFAFVVILQVLLSSLAIGLVFKMARTLVPQAYALIPALVYALDPLVVLSDTAVVTDGLFCALFVCIIYLAFFQSRLRGIVRWVLVGALLGIAIMIRPIAEFLVILFPLLFVLRDWMRTMHEDGSRWKSICAFLVGCAIILVPWMVRNEIYFNAFEITNLGGNDLLANDVRSFLAWRALANSPHPIPAILVMRHEGDPIFVSVDQEIAASVKAATPPGKNPANYDGTVALHYILDDPFRYAYFDIVNTVPFFISSSIASYGQIAAQLRDNQDFYAPTMISLLGALDQIRHPANTASFLSAARTIAPIALEILWWLCVTALALYGLVVRRRDFSVILFVILIVYFAALTGPMSSSRYRIPVEPYLVMLAAAGAQIAIGRTRKKLPAQSHQAVSRIS